MVVNHCTHIGPNGPHNYHLGIHINGQWHPFPFVEIKIRPKNCTNKLMCDLVD